jgi:hypothetical protein
LLSDPRDRFCGAYRPYRPDGDLLPHDKCPMADILRDGIPVTDQEVVIERPDGSRGVALVNIRPLNGAHPQKWAGQAADLTICRACSCSNLTGLRYPSAEWSRLLL